MQVERVAMLSLHTSPLEQPGSGDAGGMNVYIRSLALRLAQSGIGVDVITRAGPADAAAITELADGVRVLRLCAGRPMHLPKEELPSHLASEGKIVAELAALLSAEPYQVIHSHYWLSGMAALWADRRRRLPLVHTMHTMGKVKNLYRDPAEAHEPVLRLDGEQTIVDRADRLIANTATEADELLSLYSASGSKIDVVPPGVDLSVFRPGSRDEARRRLGLGPDGFHILFAGRVQRLKGPHVLVEAMAQLRHDRPDIPVQVTILGSASGSARYDLAPLIRRHGLEASVQMRPPVSAEVLADWYRAVDAVAMPSSSESFGLVALEAQACGTPVVATRVGGLAEAVADGETGLLVDGHDPRRWAEAIAALYDDAERRRRMGAAAADHASGFGWEHTAELTAASYRRAAADRG